MLLRSDGVALSLGALGKGAIPPLENGQTYTKVAAGMAHCVLLRSDGAAFGIGTFPCAIPALEGELSYTQIAAVGGWHAVLLRSDGAAVAVHSHVNEQGAKEGQCDVPALEDGVAYLSCDGGSDTGILLTLHIDAAEACGQVQIECTTMGGESVASVRADRSTSVHAMRQMILEQLDDQKAAILMLPDGSVLENDDILLGIILEGREVTRSAVPNAIELFRRFDSDGSGTIDVEDLRRVCLHIGVSDEDLDAVFIEYDTNGDGVLDYGEFLKWLSHSG